METLEQLVHANKKMAGIYIRVSTEDQARGVPGKYHVVQIQGYLQLYKGW